jgi:hypothetical protein
VKRFSWVMNGMGLCDPDKTAEPEFGYLLVPMDEPNSVGR